MSDPLAGIDKAVVGGRMRRIRQQMGLSVRDLAAMAEVSKMSVVGLEQGKNFRLTTLQKLAVAMGLHIDRLLHPDPSEERPYAVHRREDSQWYDLTNFAHGPYASGEMTPELRSALHDKGCQVPLNILASRLENGRVKPTIMVLTQESETRSHQGEEHVFVLNGAARITIAGTALTIEKGESVTFWSGEPHSYAPAQPGQECTILSVRVDS